MEGVRIPPPIPAVPVCGTERQSPGDTSHLPLTRRRLTCRRCLGLCAAPVPLEDAVVVVDDVPEDAAQVSQTGQYALGWDQLQAGRDRQSGYRHIPALTAGTDTRSPTDTAENSSDMEPTHCTTETPTHRDF